MPSLSDLKRVFFIKALGLTPDVPITTGDLEQLYFNTTPVSGAAPEKYLRGTGSPEGAVAAPVGTVYIDDSGTNGAWQWLKISGGAGNTGWAVSYGDTGWRDIPVTVSNHPGLTNLKFRLFNGVVTFSFNETEASAGGTGISVVWTIPSELKPKYPAVNGIILTSSGALAPSSAFYSTGSSLVVRRAAAASHAGSLSYPIDRGIWPTSLPGSAE